MRNLFITRDRFCNQIMYCSINIRAFYYHLLMNDILPVRCCRHCIALSLVWKDTKKQLVFLSPMVLHSLCPYPDVGRIYSICFMSNKLFIVVYLPWSNRHNDFLLQIRIVYPIHLFPQWSIQF